MAEVLFVPLRGAVLGVAMELLADGASNKDIAERLGVSPNTVKSHVKAILQVAGCQSRTEFAVKVLRRRICLTPPSTSS